MNHLDILHLTRISKNVLQNIKFPENSNEEIELPEVIFKIDISNYTNDININNSNLNVFFQNIISHNVIKGVEIIKPNVSIGNENIIQIEKVQIKNTIQKSTSFQSLHDAFNPNSSKDEKLNENSMISISIRSPEVIFVHDTNLGINSDKLGLGIKGITKIIQNEWKDTLFLENFKSQNSIEFPMIKLILEDVKLDFDDNPIEKSLAIHLQIWEEEYVNLDYFCY